MNGSREYGFGFCWEEGKRIEGNLGLVMDLGFGNDDPEESEGISGGWNVFFLW